VRTKSFSADYASTSSEVASPSGAKVETESLRSQFATSRSVHGGRRSLLYVSTLACPCDFVLIPSSSQAEPFDFVSELT
jgi:hypothetical protein